MKQTADKNTGFTLIELLIVIALLGALAIGLLATIDPFEQLKKGRDTASRNTVTEFYNANLRYYGTKGQFPWGTGASFSGYSLGSNGTSWIPELISTGELKNNFTIVQDANRLNRIVVSSGAPDDMAVCFQPESKNFRIDPNTIYDANGATQASTGGAGDCRAYGGSLTTCFWCIH
jgi:prepilin-type N-terminal cleavage/methylation domain-containing protein